MRFQQEPNNFMSRSLLLLGSISQYIRAVAWDVPQLWSHISITLGHDPSCRKAQVSGLTSWLSRSGGCPLYIRLECTTTSPAVQGLVTSSEESQSIDHLWASDPPFAAVEVIIAHCARWEEIYLMLPYECYVHIFQNPAGSRWMPMLRQLTLVSRKNWLTGTQPENTPDMEAFVMASALKEVNLTSFPSRPFIQALPWSQLTRFRGYHLRLADALDALHRGAFLEACTLTCATGYPPVHVPLTHSRLRMLTLEGNTTALKYLTLPALESLRITTQRAFSAQQCVQLLRRSSSRLTSLHISVNFIATPDLIECLEAAPALRELELFNRNDRIRPAFEDDVIERLTLLEGKQPLVPHLRRLEVLGCSCQFEIEKLGRMLWSRWDHSTPNIGSAGGQGSIEEGEWGPLKHFRLDANSAPSLSWERTMRLPQIRRLSQLGMVIQVT